MCNPERGMKNPDPIHAEVDAINAAKIFGFDLIGSTFHITHEPCLQCAMLIVECGAEAVEYLTSSTTHEGIEHLQQKNIKVKQCQL